MHCYEIDIVGVDWFTDSIPISGRFEKNIYDNNQYSNNRRWQSIAFEKVHSIQNIIHKFRLDETFYNFKGNIIYYQSLQDWKINWQHIGKLKYECLAATNGFMLLSTTITCLMIVV